jgi:hypothetical protein
MIKLILLACSLLLLAACSPPQPPQPSGEWQPVNHIEHAGEQTGAAK